MGRNLCDVLSVKCFDFSLDQVPLEQRERVESDCQLDEFDETEMESPCSCDAFCHDRGGDRRVPGYRDLLVILPIICWKETSRPCHVSFPINVNYDFQTWKWIDGDTNQSVRLPWDQSHLHVCSF